MSLAELRKELRELRKEHMKAPSRMRKGDISAEIERLRGRREETAAAAAVPSAPVRKSRAAVESIKEAKASEFPVKPDHEAKPTAAKKPVEPKAPAKGKAAPKAEPKAKPSKSKMTKAALRALLDGMASESDEE